MKKLASFTKKVIKSHSGFSLMEITIGAGMLGVISLGVMQMTTSMQKSSKTMSYKFTLEEIRMRVFSTLGSSLNCAATMRVARGAIPLPAPMTDPVLTAATAPGYPVAAGEIFTDAAAGPASFGVLNVGDIVTSAGRVVLNVNTIYGDGTAGAVTYKGFTLMPDVGDVAMMILNFERRSQVDNASFTSANLTRRMQINLTTGDAVGGQITGCIAGGVGNFNELQAHCEAILQGAWIPGSGCSDIRVFENGGPNGSILADGLTIQDETFVGGGASDGGGLRVGNVLGGIPLHGQATFSTSVGVGIAAPAAGVQISNSLGVGVAPSGVDGDINASNNAAIGGNTTIGGTTISGGKLTVTADGLEVTGPGIFNNDLSVTGNTAIGGNTTIGGTTISGGKLTVTAGGLEVTGVGNFNNDLNVFGDFLAQGFARSGKTAAEINGSTGDHLTTKDWVKYWFTDKNLDPADKANIIGALLDEAKNSSKDIYADYTLEKLTVKRTSDGSGIGLDCSSGNFLRGITYDKISQEIRGRCAPEQDLTSGRIKVYSNRTTGVLSTSPGQVFNPAQLPWSFRRIGGSNSTAYAHAGGPSLNNYCFSESAAALNKGSFTSSNGSCSPNVYAPDGTLDTVRNHIRRVFPGATGISSTRNGANYDTGCGAVFKKYFCRVRFNVAGSGEAGWLMPL